MKQDYITVKILRQDYKRLKKWAVIRDMKFYELVSLLVDKNK